MKRDKSVTLTEAKDEIDASDAKVTAAYNLARERKTGRLLMEDIRRALDDVGVHPPKQSGGIKTKNQIAAGMSMTPGYGPMGSKEKSVKVKRRRGGGIAKRGFGIAK